MTARPGPLNHPFRHGQEPLSVVDIFTTAAMAFAGACETLTWSPRGTG
jgi:hypothetical protein